MGSGFPRGALVLAAWVGLGWAVQALAGSPPFLGLLPGAALVLLTLAFPVQATEMLTSLPLATLQLGFLALLALRYGTGAFPHPLASLPVQAMLALLCASTLLTTWKRAPYDAARGGFPVVHLGPALLLLALPGPRWLALPGLAALLLGSAWMFYAKPLLRPSRDKVPPPLWQRFTLQGTRILFLGTLTSLALPVLRRTPLPPWAPVAGLLLALALHLHHVKGWKGARAQMAGLAAWGLSAGAFFALRAPGMSVR